MEDTVSYREFVSRAILKLRKEGEVGIHSVRSGFNEAFLDYYGYDPQGILGELIKQGFITTVPVEDGVMIYLLSEIESTENDQHLSVQSPRRIKTMKWGEIILLWVAGLWTVFVLLGLDLDIKNPLIVDPRLFASVSEGTWVPLIDKSLPIWIICGLLWVTIYKRKK